MKYRPVGELPRERIWGQYKHNLGQSGGYFKKSAGGKKRLFVSANQLQTSRLRHVINPGAGNLIIQKTGGGARSGTTPAKVFSYP